MYFFVLCLNNKNRLQGYNLVSIGTVSECIVHPREIFQPALLTNATSIIIVHNHPSECLDPSREDMVVTKIINEASKIIGIPLLDHIIYSDIGFYSMKENGHFD